MYTNEEVSWACVEVDRQHESALSVPGFLFGWEWTTNDMGFRAMPDFADLFEIHRRVVGDKTPEGFRITPVVFRNGGYALNHEHIDRQIGNLFVADITPYDWTHRFLEIHPFADGNGRVAAILFNHLSGNNGYPVNLPNFDFSDVGS